MHITGGRQGAGILAWVSNKWRPGERRRLPWFQETTGIQSGEEKKWQGVARKHCPCSIKSHLLLCVMPPRKPNSKELNPASRRMSKKHEKVPSKTQPTAEKTPWWTHALKTRNIYCWSKTNQGFSTQPQDFEYSGWKRHSSLGGLCVLTWVLVTSISSALWEIIKPSPSDLWTSLYAPTVDEISNERGKMQHLAPCYPRRTDWCNHISKDKMSIILNLKYLYPFVCFNLNVITLAWIINV